MPSDGDKDGDDVVIELPAVTRIKKTMETITEEDQSITDDKKIRYSETSDEIDMNNNDEKALNRNEKVTPLHSLNVIPTIVIEDENDIKKKMQEKLNEYKMKKRGN